jgi:hypothetical protein
VVSRSFMWISALFGSLLLASEVPVSGEDAVKASAEVISDLEIETREFIIQTTVTQSESVESLDKMPTSDSPPPLASTSAKYSLFAPSEDLMAKISRLSNQCTESDVEIWSDGEFSRKLTAFSVKNVLSVIGKNAKRLKKLFPTEICSLSDNCQLCWIETVFCVSTNCSLECGKDRNSAECLECNDKYCKRRLIDCTGIESERLPQKPSSVRKSSSEEIIV